MMSLEGDGSHTARAPSTRLLESAPVEGEPSLRPGAWGLPAGPQSGSRSQRSREADADPGEPQKRHIGG